MGFWFCHHPSFSLFCYLAGVLLRAGCRGMAVGAGNFKRHGEGKWECVCGARLRLTCLLPIDVFSVLLFEFATSKSSSQKRHCCGIAHSQSNARHQCNLASKPTKWQYLLAKRFTQFRRETMKPREFIKDNARIYDPGLPEPPPTLTQWNVPRSSPQRLVSQPLSPVDVDDGFETSL